MSHTTSFTKRTWKAFKTIWLDVLTTILIFLSVKILSFPRWTGAMEHDTRTCSFARIFDLNHAVSKIDYHQIIWGDLQNGTCDQVTDPLGTLRILLKDTASSQVPFWPDHANYDHRWSFRATTCILHTTQCKNGISNTNTLQILQSCTKHLICMHHSYLMGLVVNSLAPGRSEGDSKNVIFNLVLLIGIFRSSHDNALRWMPQDLTDDKSTLVQVMAWCRQATSYYLSQCWLRSLSPYGVVRPQWVKTNRRDINFQSVKWY